LKIGQHLAKLEAKIEWEHFSRTRCITFHYWLILTLMGISRLYRTISEICLFEINIWIIVGILGSFQGHHIFDAA